MTHHRFFLLIGLLLFSFLESIAQNEKGSLVVKADPKIDQVMQYYHKLNTSNPGLNGFRVQLFFDSGNQSKQNAIEAKEKFENNRLDEEAYLIFEEPYYKVRVGNFRTKIEVEGFLNQIVSLYPEAFVVPDFINFPKLFDETDTQNEADSILQDENFENDNE